MILHKSAGIGRAVTSSSVISRRFKHVLPDLPYDYGALEPVISAEIMRLHHQKHHATLQKGDVRAAVTLQGGLKINRDLKTVRCFSSGDGKQDQPSVSPSKRELDKSKKELNSSVNRLIAALWFLFTIICLDWYSAVQRNKKNRMQRE